MKSVYWTLLAAVIALPAASPARAQEMVRVPAGAFTMGTDDGPADERPAHSVTLRAFEIDRLPVKNAQFALFLERRGAAHADGRRYFDWDDSDARIHRAGERWRADAGFADHPVIEASWLGAAEYCRSVGKRLPTEAEWEKAARGTDARRYPWGSEAPDASRARFGGRYGDIEPVGSRPAGASPYGALDMAGNVWQWVSSAYRPYPYRADDGREDPAAGPARGTRGGSHDFGPEALRASERGRTVSRGPAAGHHNIGFRCARQAGLSRLGTAGRATAPP
jgi:formylglycine-generating enzyme required for sulfatase activity